MKSLRRLTDTQLIFLCAAIGYFMTLLEIVAVMKFQLNAFKLVGILFVPFALSTFLVSWWYGPKVKQASSSGQSVFKSILAALFTSLLTCTISGIALTIFAIQSNKIVFNVSTNMTVFLLYVLAGLLYSVPGILIAGVFLGRVIYLRKH